MSDQTDLLAQLTRLHAQGLLTDAEYEAKKNTLLGRSAPRSESTQGADKDDRHNRPSIRKRSAYAALLAFVVLGFLGFLISQAGKPTGGKPSPPVSVDGTPQASVLPVPPSGDGWTTTTERDPMTDVSYGQVAARVPGQQSDAEVLVRCGSDGGLSYMISTFDKDGQPTPMRISQVAPTVFGSPAGSSQYTPPRVFPGYSAIGYEIRAGSEKSIQLTFARPQYNNQVKLAGPVGTPTAELLFQLAGSAAITVRLPMPYGEETYQWSQAVEPFKSVATPCLLAKQKVKAKEYARTKAVAEQPKALPFPN